MMLNHPDYVTIWVGLGKIGLSTALINTNATGNTFIHSCTVALAHSNMKILIIDSALSSSVSKEIQTLKDNGVTVQIWSTDGGDASLKSVVATHSSQRPARSLRGAICESDAMLYVFTSGTTGLPKACKISHTKFYLVSLPYRIFCHLSPKDRIYGVLPLYHSSGGVLCTGTALMSGACLVLRKKFSASNFTADCLKYQITTFQYIGELCRYLVSLPENDLDRQLRIKSAFGNGLRPDIWEKFTQRYHIGRIVEFYGATEGNVGLFNNFDKVGAIGFIPRLLDVIYPVKIIKVEPANPTVPLRDAKGRCIECTYNEVGLLICQVNTTKRLWSIERRFEGYTDQKETNNKLLRGVVTEGDTFFNTGDLLSRDFWGFFFWSDRVGDTFRWKGENVATTEVEGVLSQCDYVQEATVYGVTVPNCDGRAGMAKLPLDPEVRLDGQQGEGTISLETALASIVDEFKKHLPAYARPLFLRVSASQEGLATTGTFKHVKYNLVKEGFNPQSMNGDLLLWFRANKNAYEPLTPQQYEEINSGKIRL